MQVAGAAILASNSSNKNAIIKYPAVKRNSLNDPPATSQQLAAAIQAVPKHHSTNYVIAQGLENKTGIQTGLKKIANGHMVKRYNSTITQASILKDEYLSSTSTS
jgi:hypothetical protein